ncbi:Glycoside hydrolase, 38 vacuolar alpha mannosidase [Dipsacomyces acuminosporus]|nr:Glycoside hydrolase, 38 vacuolar alpha mannosidase [Dipsacomyces acuminosporus]
MSRHHMSYLQKHRDITKSRLNNFLDDYQWKDVNIHSALYDLRIGGEPHIKLEVWSAPGQDRPPFSYAVKQEFRPTKAGEAFGPSWTTHWFRVTVTIPPSFAGKPVQLLFDSNSEAMVWSVDGEPLHALTGGGGEERHVDHLLTSNATDHEQPRLLYIEMACNDLFGNGDYHIHPQERPIYYQLSTVELVAPNESAWALYRDLEVIIEMASRLPQDSVRSWQALSAANSIINVFERKEPSTIEPAREISRKFFEAKVGGSAHQVWAVGHCHIDTAWLWPFAETRRKSARSWATQVNLMDRFPEYKFAASQAQQYEWVKEDYPSLFARIQEKAKAGQFIPIGATWVEMDCNIPSGESLARQFLLGQRFYEEHFGERCKVFWLPDTFGYSSQLPQIVRLSDAKYFFTQKLSWNNINRFPSSTFRWVGLDGSQVLTHMAPSNTYGAQCRPGELIDSIKNHKDIAYSNDSLYLYGNGDGGGGPLDAMLERLRRMENVDGLPKVKNAHPNEFYEHVEDSAKDLVSWKGELYFELHRGTYTSQSNNKRWNRQSEFLMRDVEMLSTIAHVLSLDRDRTYPSEEITRLWKLICLNQFHDVVPGSAIGMVYRDSANMYKDIFASGERLRQNAINRIYGSAVLSNASEATGAMVINTTGWMRTGIITVPKSLEPCFSGFNGNAAQVANKSGQLLVLAENVPGCGTHIIDSNEHTSSQLPIVPVRVFKESDGNFILENSYVQVTIGPDGQIKSYYDRRDDRELVPVGQAGNFFELYDDVPVYWDAWDIEIYAREKFKPLPGTEVSIVDNGPLIASLTARLPISEDSVLTQTISLSAVSPRLDFDCEIDWHESRKCLKVSFTWDIYSDVATYETQYGVVQRPTHRNTSWDMAKFEVCAHKFADLSEYGYGVALLNDCKYGHSTLENTMTLTLLRAPKAPDENCDMGHHTFRYAVYPHQGTLVESNVVQEAYQFNTPLLTLPVDTNTLKQSFRQQSTSHPFFSISNAPNVVLDTVKVAEDEDNSYIVRMYEALGGHARALFTTALPASKIERVNILEDHIGDVEWLPYSRSATIRFKPFEIITLKLTL